MASILIPLGILHRQEGAASHAWIYIALLQLFHDFCGNDWRLMSAIAYHESRFTADIVSRRGARGLMQYGSTL